MRLLKVCRWNFQSQSWVLIKPCSFVPGVLESSHLERRTGAISQTLDNGLNGYQMVLHTLVFTILPVATELGTIVVVLARLNQPTFLGFFCGAILAYAAAFWYAAHTIMTAAQTASD